MPTTLTKVGYIALSLCVCACMHHIFVPFADDCVCYLEIKYKEDTLKLNKDKTMGARN